MFSVKSCLPENLSWPAGSASDWFLLLFSLPNTRDSRIPSNIDRICYDMHTFWLFIWGDVPSFIVPGCFFGLCGALSGSLTISNGPSISSILMNLPKVLLFTVLDCLVFDLANQSMPGAEQEDAINKPWRPIPARRISQRQARVLMLVVIPAALFSSFCLGVYVETATLFVMSWMYNDVGGSDINYWVRNTLLCTAFFLYNLGSLKLAAGHGAIANSSGYLWASIVSCIIFTTMQIQDMKDQAGDAKRNRRTVPLVVGDAEARWTIAVPMMFWMIFCPIFWHCGFLGFLVSVGCGGCVVARLLLLRDVDADAKTYNFWAMWLILLYSMPLWSRI